MKLSTFLKIFFCNQKVRFIFLWLFASLFFCLFALLGRFKDLGEFVTLSVSFPLFLYFIIVYGKTWKEAIKHRKVKETSHPEFTELARKENPKIKKVVVKKLLGKVAHSKGKEKIVLSKALFTGEFSKSELKALLYHEISHTKTKKYDWIFLILFFPLWIFILSTFVFFPSWSIVLFFADGFFCSIYMIYYERTRWLSEYKADEEATKKVGTDIFISALMKTSPPEKRNCDSPAHPSVNRRISRMKKYSTS